MLSSIKSASFGAKNRVHFFARCASGAEPPCYIFQEMLAECCVDAVEQFAVMQGLLKDDAEA